MAATPQRRHGDVPQPTGARVRDATDNGLTGDKVNYGDPAAAPLGTDAEAAGHPPRPGDASPQPAAAIPEGRAKGHELPARTTLGIAVTAALATAAAALVVAALLL